MHRGLEQPVAALALALGGVHRRVGVADQLLGAARVAGDRDRDAEAGAAARSRARPTRSGAASRSSTRWAASAAAWRRRPRAARRTRRRRSGRRCRRRAPRRRARAATATSTSSPTACPSESLISLKSSRSRKRTASVVPSRRPRASAWRVCSMNIGRFASPVTASWNAWCFELGLERLALGDVAGVERGCRRRAPRRAGSSAAARTRAWCRPRPAACTRTARLVARDRLVEPLAIAGVGEAVEQARARGRARPTGWST